MLENYFQPAEEVRQETEKIIQRICNEKKLEIIKKINDAKRKGEMSVEIFNLDMINKKELEDLNYKIEYHYDNIHCEQWYTISWER